MSNEKPTTHPNIRLGTIGHDKHGKTTLANALLKFASEQYKTHAANNKREIIEIKSDDNSRTYSFNSVSYKSDKRVFSLVDCTEGKECAQCLLATSAMRDGAILVCSLTEGPMAQTHEQVSLCKAAGVPRIVVFLSMADLSADAEMDELTESQVREILVANGYDGETVTIVSGSAQMALENKDDGQLGTSSIKKLINTLDTWNPAPERLPTEQTVEIGEAVTNDTFKMKIYLNTKEEGAVGAELPTTHRYQINLPDFSETALIIFDSQTDYLERGKTYSASVTLPGPHPLRTGSPVNLVLGPIVNGVGRITSIGK